MNLNFMNTLGNQNEPDSADSAESAGSFREKARSYYLENMPVNWDMAYQYYTAEDAPAILEEEDRSNILNILNHGKYNKRILRRGIVAFICLIVGVILSGWVDVFTISPVLKIICIVLEALILVYGIYIHRRDEFANILWVLPGMFVIWVVYLFFWLM